MKKVSFLDAFTGTVMKSPSVELRLRVLISPHFNASRYRSATRFDVRNSKNRSSAILYRKRGIVTRNEEQCTKPTHYAIT